jgi:hypothetical protein
MEGLTKRLFVFGGAVMAMGAIMNFAPRPSQKILTESDIEKLLPTKVGDFSCKFEGSTAASYKMPQSTYDTLKPWGIVARVFRKANESYDVVAVASRSGESFHNPQVCFTAQGWVLSNERVELLHTKTRGDVPVTIVDMANSTSKTNALYFFKVNSGYYGPIRECKINMAKYMFTHFGKSDEGAFIRVIPTTEQSVDNIKKFTADWIDEANKVSNGYY